MVLAELFPLEIPRIVDGDLGIFSCGIMNAVVSYLFPLLQAKLAWAGLLYLRGHQLFGDSVRGVRPAGDLNKSLETVKAELSANHEDKNLLVSREVGYDR